MRYEFVYNEPGTGSIDIDGPGLTEEEAVREIEEKFPTYIDIEIIGTSADGYRDEQYNNLPF